MRRRMLGLVSLVWLLLPHLALGQGNEICPALLAYGTFDSSGTFTDAQRFQQVQSILRTQRIETTEQAQRASAEASIPILNVLSVAAGGSVDNSNIRKVRDDFLSMTFGEFFSRDQARQTLRVASRVLAEKFVECIKSAQGLTGYVTQSADRDAFQIYLQYRNPSASNHFSLTGLRATEDIECERGAHQAALGSSEIPFQGSATIICKALNPGRSRLLSINTTQGPITGPGGQGIELVGRDPTIRALEERLSLVEAAIVPRGMVAFFNSADCPSGWLPHEEAAGRYLVALQRGETRNIGLQIGEPLKSQENRSAGQMNFSAVLAGPVGAHIVGQACPNGAVGIASEFRNDGGVRFCLPSNVRLGSDVVGTPAPYLLLTACRKL